MNRLSEILELVNSMENSGNVLPEFKTSYMQGWAEGYKSAAGTVCRMVRAIIEQEMNAIEALDVQ